MKNTKIMVTKLACLFVIAANMLNAMATKDQYKQHLIQYEGKTNTVYLCSSGIKTVGIGINLKARNLDNKYKVGDKISESLLNLWFNEEIIKTEQAAQKIFPSFKSQPEKIQILLVSLTYNLGNEGINKFVKFRTAINNKNYKTAAKELKDSKWYYQTGKRGRDYVWILNNS